MIAPLKVPADVRDKILGEFEGETPLSEWGIRSREARERVGDNVVFMALAMAVDSDKPGNFTNADIVSSIRRAVAEGKKQGPAAAVQYLLERGINRKTLVDRGLGCSRTFSPEFHTGPFWEGLEILMPLGVGKSLPVEGQPTGGPPTVFDGEWGKLGYPPSMVARFRRERDAWWHTDDTTKYLNLHTNPNLCLGRNPPPEAVEAKRSEVMGLVENPQMDAFSELVNQSATKPALDAMRIGLPYLLQHGVTPEQAIRLGYSPNSITEAVGGGSR